MEDHRHSFLKGTEGLTRRLAAAFVGHFMHHEDEDFAKRYRDKAVRTSAITLHSDESVVFEFSPEQLRELRPHVRTLLESALKSRHAVFLAVYADVYGRDAAQMLVEADKLKKFPDYLKQMLKRMCGSASKRAKYKKMSMDELNAEMEEALDEEMNIFYEGERP